MGATRIASTKPGPYTQSRSQAAFEVYVGHTGARCIDGMRAGLAGGIWLLLLYSLGVALLVGLGHPPGSGVLLFWKSVLQGLDGGSSLAIGLGFPLAFLHGAGAAWLFAAIYSIVPTRRRETEAS